MNTLETKGCTLVRCVPCAIVPVRFINGFVSAALLHTRRRRLDVFTFLPTYVFFFKVNRLKLQSKNKHERQLYVAYQLHMFQRPHLHNHDRTQRQTNQQLSLKVLLRILACLRLTAGSQHSSRNRFWFTKLCRTTKTTTTTCSQSVCAEDILRLFFIVIIESLLGTLRCSGISLPPCMHMYAKVWFCVEVLYLNYRSAFFGSSRLSTNLILSEEQARTVVIAAVV